MSNADEYPTDEDLDRVRSWPYRDFGGLMHFVRDSCWSHVYGKITQEGRTFRLVTGGWSGNEEVIDALDNCPMFNAICWQSSHRGGLHVYEVPEIDMGTARDPSAD